MNELGGTEDSAAVIDAANSGVSVCASVHGSSLQDAARRAAIAALMAQRAFGLYAVLSAEGGGVISGVFDRNGNPLKTA